MGLGGPFNSPSASGIVPYKYDSRHSPTTWQCVWCPYGRPLWSLLQNIGSRTCLWFRAKPATLSVQTLWCFLGETVTLQHPLGFARVWTVSIDFQTSSFSQRLTLCLLIRVFESGPVEIDRNEVCCGCAWWLRVLDWWYISWWRALPASRQVLESWKAIRLSWESVNILERMTALAKPSQVRALWRKRHKGRHRIGC